MLILKRKQQTIKNIQYAKRNQAGVRKMSWLIFTEKQDGYRKICHLLQFSLAINVCAFNSLRAG